MPELIKRLDAGAADFDQALARLLAWDEDEQPAIVATVQDIIAAIRRDGDVALLELTNRFDRRALDSATDLEVR